MSGSSQERKKMSFKVEPVPAEQRDWLYSDPAKDAERGCIGHLRFDTGRSGKEFWTSWWPHNETLNRQPFKKEFDQVVNTLRKKGNPLSDLYSMIHFCGEHGNEAALSQDFRSFGFKIETKAHEYLLRLTPFRGDYSYIYCYDKEAQRTHVKDQAWEHLTADDVKNIQCVESQYFPVIRTAEHTLTCEIHGEPVKLFYEVSKHDDGEGFTIHSDGKDIWDLMPEPELRKLEPLLSQAVSFAGWQKELEQSETAAAVRDVRYGLYETEYLNMSREQISALHEAIDRKEAALATAEGRSSEKQSVLEDLKTTKTNPRETKATRKPKKKEESR